MIIFGFGRRRNRDYGQGRSYTCPNCRNNVRYQLIMSREWFSLFFIPVIPYSRQYLEMCPICRYGGQLSKAEFDERLLEAKADNNYLTGGPSSLP